MAKNILADKILIIDLDVHQGNGNSEIFKNDNQVFTFSMHAKVNYPAKKSISDLDIELEENLEDREYIDILKNMFSNMVIKKDISVMPKYYSRDFKLYSNGKTMNYKHLIDLKLDN